MGWWQRLFGKRNFDDLDAAIAELEADPEIRAAVDGETGLHSGETPEPRQPKKLVIGLNAADGVWMSANGSYEQAVVGESHYQRALSKICGGQTEEGHRLEVDAELVYEDSNPYDSNAVAVQIGGALVGYLPRDVARELRERAVEVGAPVGVPIRCKARIRGGWSREGGADRGSFGVWLDFRRTKDGKLK